MSQIMETKGKPVAHASKPVSNVDPRIDLPPVCAACKSTRIEVLMSDQGHEYTSEGAAVRWPYRLVRCVDCGMGFVDPMPSMSIANTFYSSEYGNYQAPDEGDGPITPIKRRVARWRMRDLLNRNPAAMLQVALGLIVETATGKTVPAPLGIPLQFPLDAAMFDLGYGSGSWMESMARLGYRNLHGYDIDANLANVERLSSKGFRLSSGDFLNNDYPENYFDCIRLSHVFEHLIDPVPVLVKCRKMLRPGGVIAMAHPCFRSWIAKLGLEYSPSLMLPMHLYHHTPTSTALMLKQAGFVNIRVHPFSVAGQFAAMVNNKRRTAGRGMIPPSVFQFLAPAYRIFGILTGRGDFMSAWAQAPAQQ